MQGALRLCIALVTAVGCVTASGPEAIIRTSSGGTVRFAIEIADTDELRGRGLMGRERLPADAGMAFLWPTDTRSPFYMRDTLVALDIAFFDAGGTIVRILEMAPCRAEPCPLYDPGLAYRGALEVNAGALAGVGVGDAIEIRRPPR